jgi:NDP-sugar pyrophosphorylase family protein
VSAHRELGGIATLAYYVSHDTAGKGLLELGDGDRVVGFTEKPARTAPGRVNAGIYACEPAILELIEPGYSDFGYDVWPAALAAGHALYGAPVDGYAYDVGTPALLEMVEREIAAGSIRW